MEKISPIKEKILYFIENQKITKVDFCEKTGISYANIKGKGLFSEIGGTQIGKILSTYPQISPEWLLTGKGEMLRETKSKENKKNTLQSSQTTASEDKDTKKNASAQENNSLIVELLGRLEKQSEEIGRLKEENKHLQEQLAEKNTLMEDAAGNASCAAAV